MSDTANKASPGEPDFTAFRFLGLKCVILRSVFGHLCGYVQIPPGKLRDRLVRRMRQPGWKLPIHDSKLRRKNGYNHRLLNDVEVHGGLTFCGSLKHYSHRTERGLYLGFVCAHAGDLVPNLPASYGQYRDIRYVKNELICLVAQLVPLLREARS